MNQEKLKNQLLVHAIDLAYAWYDLGLAESSFSNKQWNSLCKLSDLEFHKKVVGMNLGATSNASRLILYAEEGI